MIDGIPWVRIPALVDPARPLRRNTLHHDTRTARHTGDQIRLQLEPRKPEPRKPEPRKPEPRKPEPPRPPEPAEIEPPEAHRRM
jgi:hypothetical protein